MSRPFTQAEAKKMQTAIGSAMTILSLRPPGLSDIEFFCDRMLEALPWMTMPPLDLDEDEV